MVPQVQGFWPSAPIKTHSFSKSFLVFFFPTKYGISKGIPQESTTLIDIKYSHGTFQVSCNSWCVTINALIAAVIIFQNTTMMTASKLTNCQVREKRLCLLSIKKKLYIMLRYQKLYQVNELHFWVGSRIQRIYQEQVFKQRKSRRPVTLADVTDSVVFNYFTLCATQESQDPCNSQRQRSAANGTIWSLRLTRFQCLCCVIVNRDKCLWRTLVALEQKNHSHFS